MNKKTVCIVGLGYVGVPMLHAILTSTSHNLIAYDISSERIDSLKQSKLPDSLQQYSEIFSYPERVRFTAELCEESSYDAYIVCVPTPLTSDGRPNLDYVENAFFCISNHSKKDSIIALESTVHPGCTRELYTKFFASKPYKSIVAFSPEREDPGNVNYTIQTIPKLVSSIHPEHLEVVAHFYEQFINTVVQVSSTEVAELSKLLENTQRAVNISLMNELKQYTSHIGIDIFEVINAASTKPFGFTKYTPGPGIGGHCIPIDPTYLHWAAKNNGFYLDFIEQATKVNAKLPSYIESILTSTVASKGLVLQNTTAIFVGLTYKPDIDDLRSSPSLQIYRQLRHYFKETFVVDPYCTHQVPNCHSSLDFADSSSYVSFILTDHSSLDYSKLLDISQLIFDSRGKYPLSDRVIRI